MKNDEVGIAMSKEYDENENFRKYVEAEIQKNPLGLMNKYAFYRIGALRSPYSDTVLFPVLIIDGRKLFGRLQYLITPLCRTDCGVYSRGSPLGKRWVDRKALILSHDHEYRVYERCIGEDVL